MPRDEDHWHGDAGPAQCIENVRPGEARHPHVDQDDVRLEGRHGVEHLGARRDSGYLVALAGEEDVQKLKQRRFIVGDQDAARSGLQ